MNWVTITWSALAAACVTLAAIHGVVWTRNLKKSENGAFAVLAILAAVLVGIDLAQLTSSSPEEYQQFALWSEVPVLFIVVTEVLYVRASLRVGRNWLAWSVISTSLLLVVISLVFRESLHLHMVTHMEPLTFLGETVFTPGGKPSLWLLADLANIVLLAVFLADACLMLCQRGEKPQLLLVPSSLMLSIFACHLLVILVSSGMYQMPVSCGLCYLIFIGTTSCELGNDLAHARGLAQRLASDEKELRKNAVRLSLTADSVGLGFWSLDLATQHFWMTPNTRRLFQLKPDQPLSLDQFMALVHPEDQPLVRKELNDIVHLRRKGRIEYRVALADGLVRWMASRIRVMHSVGQAKSMVGVTADVTTQKLETEAAQQTCNRLASAIEAANLGFFETTDCECISYLDSRSADLTGMPLETHDGRSRFEFWFQHIHPDDQPRIGDLHGQIRDGDLNRASAEYRYLHPSRGWIWLHHLTQVFKRPPGGGQTHLVGVLRDITKRKQEELSLQETRTTLLAIIDSTDDMIWSVDAASFGLITFNQGMQNYFLQERGLRLDPGMRPEDLFPTREDAEGWCGLYQRALREGPFSIEYETRSSPNHVFQLRFRVVKRDGKAFGVSVFGKKMTEQQQAEKEILILREELARVSRVTTLGALSGSLAHELNQPLGAILSNAQAASRFLAGTSPDLAEVKTALEDIARDTKRAGEVIRQMRSLVRKSEPRLESLDINRVVSEVVRLVHSDILIRKIRIGFDLDSQLCATRGDMVQLQQVVLNLLLNAFDAMKDAPEEERTVILRTRQLQTHAIRVEVSDNGTGLSGDGLTHLFEPFRSTKRDGLGLGLSISRSIIEAHKGQIWAENNFDRGATFYFTLPAHGTDWDPPAGRHTPATAPWMPR